MSAKSKPEVLCDLGMECFKKGDTAKSIKFFEQALPLLEGDATNSLLVTALLNLGVSHMVAGDADKSAATLERALAVQEAAQGEHSPELAGTLQNLTVVYSKLGRTEQAVGCMQRAGEIESRAAAQAKVAELEAAAGPTVEEECR